MRVQCEILRFAQDDNVLVLGNDRLSRRNDRSVGGKTTARCRRYRIALEVRSAELFCGGGFVDDGLGGGAWVGGGGDGAAYDEEVGAGFDGFGGCGGAG